MPDEEWNSLLTRLRDDLEARNRGDTSETDEQAWREVLKRVLRYSQILSARARLDPDSALEIAQEILIKLQNPATLRRLRVAGSPDGYLFVIVRNEVINTLRRKRRAISSEVALTEDLISAYDPTREKVRSDQAEQLRRALRSLRPEDQQLLQMRFWQKMNITEIARSTGLKYSTVAVRLFRILKNLRERLGPNF
jgi:RNA polymerase sigma-70 factor (ECF subfamily)